MNPTGRAIMLLVLGGVGPVLFAVAVLPAWASWIPLAVCMGVLVMDRIVGCGMVVGLTRHVSKVLSLGARNPVEVRIENNFWRDVLFEVADEYPDSGETDGVGDTHRVFVRANEAGVLRYDFVPRQRGRFVFPAVQVRWQSRMGFWMVTERFEVASDVQVFPDISAISDFELLARTNSLHEAGVTAMRTVGAGHEFERMREYREGDDPRTVDWKTTARTGKLVVREMGEERNQNVVLMIDMGRMMCQITGKMSYFDYALNTAIMLGHMAIKKGDNVGLVLFSDTVVKYLPLNRGPDVMDSLMMAIYDVQPEQRATDYRQAVRHVLTHVTKRSLLLIMTHVNRGLEDELFEALSLQTRQWHLPVCLFLKDPQVDRRLRTVPRSAMEAFAVAAAAKIAAQNASSVAHLQHSGVMAVEALPEHYSALAINQYLEIKRRSRL